MAELEYIIAPSVVSTTNCFKSRQHTLTDSRDYRMEALQQACHLFGLLAWLQDQLNFTLQDLVPATTSVGFCLRYPSQTSALNQKYGQTKMYSRI